MIKTMAPQNTLEAVKSVLEWLSNHADKIPNAADGTPAWHIIDGALSRIETDLHAPTPRTDATEHDWYATEITAAEVLVIMRRLEHELKQALDGYDHLNAEHGKHVVQLVATTAENAQLKASIEKYNQSLDGPIIGVIAAPDAGRQHHGYLLKISTLVADRDRLGLTQAEAATLCHVSPRAWWTWENSQGLPLVPTQEGVLARLKARPSSDQTDLAPMPL